MLPKWMDPNKITTATIHCAATPRGRAHSAAEVSQWDIARFGQISYHYVIELDGKVTQTLRHDQLGCHTAKHNTGNLGICYVGGLEPGSLKIADTRTPAQIEAMLALVAKLRAQIPGIDFKGHRDWSPDLNGNGKIEPAEWIKGCPSFDVAAWLASVGIKAAA